MFSYSPVFKIFGNAVSGVLALPLAEFRGLPPNDVRVRALGGNRIFNNHFFF
jgi:hypothetical protein